MSRSTSAQGLRVWDERRTAHVRLLYVPGSHAAAIVDDLATRAELACRRSRGWLGAPPPPTPITLYLSPWFPDPRPGWTAVTGAVLADDREIAWLVATPELPAIDLERVVLELVVRGALGSPPPAAEGLLQALAGLLAAETGAGPDLVAVDEAARARFVADREPLQLFANVVGDEQSLAGDVSFLAFVQRWYGRGAFGPFVQAALRDGAPAAAPAVLGDPWEAIQAAWLAILGARPSPGAAVRDILRHAVPFIRRHWLREAELCAYMLLALLFSLAIPVSVKYLFDDVLTTNDFGRLATWAGVVLVLFAVASFAGYRRVVVGGLVGELVLRDLRRAGFAQLQRLGLRFYSRSESGDLLARLTGDMDAVQGVLGATLPELVFQVISLLVGALLLLALNWVLGLMVIVIGLPTLIVVYSGTSSRLRRASRALSDRVGAMAAFLQEQLSAQMVVKSFSLERRAVTSFEEILGELFAGSMRMIRLGAVLSGCTNMVYLGVQVLVLAAGAALVMSEHMSLGELVAFSGLIGQVLSPAMAISGQYRALQTATGSFDRVRELMDEVPDVVDAPDAVELPEPRREVRLEQVSFGYDEGDPVLRDVSLTIPIGSRVAIVGPSGSGKSTIVGLLLRLYDVDAGRVLVDGLDIRAVTQESLRRQIAVVPQDTYLFNANIRENIALGRDGASRADVVRAAEAAELQAVVERMEDGYDALVGERGGRLSGGQRQRLAIARALIRDPHLLILDEATSALDSHTEAGILRTLEAAGRGRTTIMITHRLSSAVGCDRIFVLDQGQLVEEGSHEELLQRRGLYWELYSEQQAAGAEAALEGARDLEEVEPEPASVLKPEG